MNRLSRECRTVRANLYFMRRSHVPVQTSIEAKLQSQFKPNYVSVQNESHMHNVPRHSETHFKVVVVAECFNGLSLLKRHRMINDCLRQELSEGMHALSIEAHTPEQWAELDSAATRSPPCMGGGVTQQNTSS